MKTVWKIIAWISVACGLFAYLTGWAALFTKSVFWGIPTQFWFYDAVAAGIFGLFFLIYAVHSD
jgi:uncharacterized membrane protein YphA (DoxX/SURF4 family)